MFRLLTISLAIVGGCGGQVTEDTPPAPQWQRIDTVQIQPVPVVPEIVKPVGQRFLRREMDGKKLSAVHSVGSQRTGQADSGGHRGGEHRLRQSSERGDSEKYGIRSWPQFNVCRRSTKKLITRFSGYTTADSLLASIKGHEKPPAAEPVGNIAQDADSLRSWVRSNYTCNQRLSWDVTPRGQVWSHLVEHGFEMRQVRPLNQWDALCLHDAVHTGRLAI
jgi:hypothetical protein